MIRMEHPLHGIKHALLESEAEADEKNGWRRAPELDASTFAAHDDIDLKLSPDADDPAERYEAIFGRLPDGRWSRARIIAELKEAGE